MDVQGGWRDTRYQRRKQLAIQNLVDDVTTVWVKNVGGSLEENHPSVYLEVGARIIP